MIHFCRVDGLVERGCYEGDSYECDELHECITCEGNFCNNHMYRSSGCLSCSGPIESDCAVNSSYLAMDEISISDCKILFGIPLCFVIIDGGLVRRGCTANEYLALLEMICGPGKDCFFCDSQNCNYMTVVFGGVRRGQELPSGSTRWSVKNWLVIIGVIRWLF